MEAKSFVIGRFEGNVSVDRKAVIFGKSVVSRKETLEYLSEKYKWQNVVIGISAFYGFWAWMVARLTGRKCIYYCIDFYSPKIADGFFDRIFILLAHRLDQFLNKVVDQVWDISDRILGGRIEFGGYTGQVSKIIPLSYPPSYFKFKDGIKNRVAYVGLTPYGHELIPPHIDFVWLRNLPLEELLNQLCCCGIGLSMWGREGNNYYGDPGKTKLYSACGLPVIMTENTPYAKVIEETKAGLVIAYDSRSLQIAIRRILINYDFYKQNVKKTWEYINADTVSRDIQILDY